MTATGPAMTNLQLWQSVDWPAFASSPTVEAALSDGGGCLEISLADIDPDIDADEVSVFHGTSVESLNGIFASGKMHEAPGAGEDKVRIRRKDGSGSCAYGSPEFCTAHRFMGVGLGVVIAAVLPPTDHDAQRGVIYRFPRKKGYKQWAVYGGVHPPA